MVIGDPVDLDTALYKNLPFLTLRPARADYLAAKTYGYFCLAGSRKYVGSVIIWEQDSGFFGGMTFS